jgi:hypothetical protein
MRIHQRKVTVAEAHPSKFNVEICGERASCRSRRWGWACSRVSPEWDISPRHWTFWIG